MDGRCSGKSHAFVSCAIWVRNTIGPFGRIAEIDMLVEELPQSKVLGQRRRQLKPALATRCSSSKVTSRRSRLWQDTRIEKVPSGRG